jgi:hypothetical protein
MVTALSPCDTKDDIMKTNRYRYHSKADAGIEHTKKQNRIKA